MIELTAIVAGIIGIVEAVKRSSDLDKKYTPILALFLGVLWFGLTGEFSISENIFSGIVAGLTASGLWSGSKTIIKN